MRKRVLIVLGTVFLLGAGAAAAYVLYKREKGEDVRGSSTVEFVTVEPKPKPPPRRKAAPVARIDWPMYGFDQQRVRAVPSVLRPPFRRLWTFRAQQLIEFPPAVAYGRLYFANNSGVFFAISAKTGRLGWKHGTGRCVAASPAVANGLVYETFLNPQPCNQEGARLEGVLIAFDARTGKVRWRFRLGPSESSPLVAGRLLYVGDWRGKVYALDARTGKVRWTFRTGDKVKGAATLVGGRLIVGSYDHHVYALNARTGRLIWRAGAQERLGNRGTFYSTPAAAYGRVYIGSTDGKLYSFGATSGELRWSQSTGGYVYASPAVWRKRIFVGSYSGTFYALDAATGDVVWKFEANGPISGSATVLGGRVYFSTLNRRTYALDPRTGRPIWSFPDGKYTPVVADAKRLYLTGYTRIYGMVPR